MFPLPHGDRKFSEFVLLFFFFSGPTLVEDSKKRLLLLQAKRGEGKKKYTPRKTVKTDVKLSPLVFLCLFMQPATV